ncbi:MAG: glycogen synthase GlgA [Negativicutes bacterium]|jgi:starch synthase
MKKVLLAGAECVPFVKTGGLADVMGALPKELKKQGVDVRVVIPKYTKIPEKYRHAMVWKKNIGIPLGADVKFCGIEEYEYEGVTFYFLDNMEYFDRPDLYGYADDYERFAFFSRAVLEFLPHVDFKPDLIHCNDWQTGMVPPLLHAQYIRNPFYANIRTLYTVHNMKYQGICAANVATHLLHFGREWLSSDKLEFHGNVSFMKGGLTYADIISTVSNSYAEEIQEPQYGEKLEGLLQARSNDLFGIVNGIDYDLYNPKTDKKIAVNYDIKSLGKKVENKLALQERLGLPVNKDIPVIGMVSRLIAAKGFGLVEQVLWEMMEYDNIQLVILGTGDPKFEELFRNAQNMYPHKLSVHMYFDATLAQQIYAGCDLFLMPSLYEPCGLSQIMAMRYGTVPIVRETGGLRDTVRAYNEHSGEGNGFSFAFVNAHDMLYTIRRAVSFFHDSKHWVKIQKNAMNSDFSWKHSAKEYVELYDWTCA